MPGRFADADPILFDLDGTLTESGPGIISSVRHALASMGLPALDDAQLRRFIGPPLLDSFQDVCGLDRAEAILAIAAYREYYATDGQYENSVYEGIPALLEGLLDAGRTLAVATSKAEVFASSILDHFALTGFFATVVGSELDGRRTGKADIITEALARLGRPTPGTVMIGDRNHDVRGAAAVGVGSIGVLWGYGDDAELTAAGADALAATPAELLGQLTP
ncbi:MAG TPA: HAD hydrolase-like protein [Motilibacterales bacterium]|nr:HAD hydrolase-like protein [Motilibacterales bacterium]